MLLVLTSQLSTAWEGSLPPTVAVHNASHGRRELTTLADVVVPKVQDGTTVLAILPEHPSRRWESQLLALRSALDTTQLVVHTTALPPLASALLVRMLGELAMSRQAVPSLLASGVARLEQLITAAAWSGAVAKLRVPAPSILQHAVSWLPWTRFAIIFDGEPSVERLRRRDLLPLPALEPADAWRIVLSAGDGDLSAVERSLEVHAPAVEVTRVPRSDESAAWWGTHRYVELAYVPRDVRQWARQLLGHREPTACGWCGELVLDDPCPLCRATVDTARTSEMPA